jgi:hypothetical protein
MEMDHEITVVLAIHATARGFGWVVFEGRHGLIDWGLKEARRDKNRESVAKVKKLIEWYAPQVLVFEDATAEHSLRHARIKELHRDLLEIARADGVRVEQISRSDVKGVFAGQHAKSRYEIAAAIAQELPPLSAWLPSSREVWSAEERRLSIFDAAALAISFFETKKASGPKLARS